MPQSALIINTSNPNVANITTATYQLEVNTVHYINYTGGSCSVTLPPAADSPLGTFVEIRGGEANTASYDIVQNTNQIIRALNQQTTLTSGSLLSRGPFDCIKIECDDASGSGLTWTVVSTYDSFFGS
jgi:hypothetical protein